LILKRIEIHGFKSFADKIVLDFNSGISAVVGPNGSGKSNISDAVRWVLGEVSAKSLRGASMQDIIFLGTEKRKPLNFAQVTLVLDNRDKIFKIDFEEVTVTRRVFRSGESSYFINKSHCRLKDITELFMDTGLGREGYSIIGQGRVDQILSTKAEDRRNLFEEAAGISKNKHEKEEAERKLKSVEENLLRIDDIIAELEKQIAPLEKQAEKAKEYFVLYDEYKILDVSMSALFIKKNQKSIEENMLNYNKVYEERKELEENEKKLESSLSKLYEKININDEENKRENERLKENLNNISDAEKQVGILENDIKNNIKISERIENDKAVTSEKKDTAESRITEFEGKIALSEEYAAVIEKRIESIRENAGEADNELKKKKNVIEGMKSDIITLMNEAASIKERMSGIDRLRQSFLERQESVNAELSGFNESMEQRQKDIENTDRLINEKSDKLIQMRERLKRFNERKARANEKNNSVTAKLNSLNIEYNSKNSRKKMLEDMENSYEGYSKSVKAVLTAQELKRCEIYGTVSSLIRTDSRYITAIETAIGGGMQNIVVENEEDAKKAIAYLKRTKAGRATFLPVSSVRMLGNPIPNLKGTAGYIGIAADLVECDMKYREIIRSMLGRIAVTDNIDTAVEISRRYGYKFRIVTLEGDVINAGGSLSGGTASKNSGFLSRTNDIKMLADELVVIYNNIKALKEEHEKNNAELASLNDQTEIYQPMVREYEDDLIKLKSESEHLKESAENGAKSKEAFENELEEIKTQLKETGEQIGILINEAASKENMVKSLETRIVELESEYDRMVRERDEFNEKNTGEIMELNSIRKDIDVFKDNILQINKEITSYEMDIRKYDEEIRDISAKNKESAEKAEQLKKSIEEFAQMQIKIQENIDLISEKKSRITDEMKSIQNSNKDVTERLLLLGEQISRLSAKDEKLRADGERVVNKLWDKYEITVTTAEEMAKPIENETETKKRIDELNSKIKSMGNLNLNAVDEYLSVKERYEFESSQRNDLTESKLKLEEMISEIYNLMSKRFFEQFNAINESFSKVFSDLFGGGTGRLYLTEPDDVLQSGIEIEVQLPGKGFRNITLYSGGEKAFIAIAILFAILKVKPTPFCILDEIDAALDDVNISRFATYLKHYADVQFIIITHRRGTMEAADTLYGVTMQEKGVSKLLSLKIDDVDEKMVE